MTTLMCAAPPMDWTSFARGVGTLERLLERQKTLL